MARYPSSRWKSCICNTLISQPRFCMDGDAHFPESRPIQCQALSAVGLNGAPGQPQDISTPPASQTVIPGLSTPQGNNIYTSFCRPGSPNGLVANEWKLQGKRICGEAHAQHQDAYSYAHGISFEVQTAPSRSRSSPIIINCRMNFEKKRFYCFHTTRGLV